MLDKASIAFGMPYWLWMMLVPGVLLLLTLGWLTMMFRRQRLSEFAVSGLGLSIQIKSNALENSGPGEASSRSLTGDS